MIQHKTDSSHIHQFSYQQADPLPVMEHFYTLQGEGAWTGYAAYFIRLAGCDVGCHWCDVKASWDVAPEQYMTGDEMLDTIKQTSANRIVITGGEPTLYDLSKWVTLFHAHGFKVHLETAGVHALDTPMDWICFSPKKFKSPLPPFYHLAHELKIVVYNKHDLEWAESHAKQCASHIQLFLQPEWSKRSSITDMILSYIQDHPYWRLSQQTHKYLGIP